ncbi:MAG: hypothetical protein AAFR66_09465 [Bacteroidota bacterium]
MNETKIGGISLFLGALVVLITIFFEYQIGWIGTERPPEMVPQFMFENWTMLGSIWAWQAVGYTLFTVAYILLLKHSNGIYSLFWAFLIVCGVLLVVAMWLAVGSYYPALEVMEQQPALFETIRGAIRNMYMFGKFGSASLTFIFILETFRKDGIIHKKAGIVMLGFITGFMLVGSLMGMPMNIVGITWFLLPLTLGYSYWKNANQ